MKILFSLIGYNCVDYIEPTLKPLLDYPNSEISVCIGCFNETAKLGYPIKSNDGTIELLTEYRQAIDHFKVLDKSMYEFEIRNKTLEPVNLINYDYIVLVDFDENWTREQLDKAIKFADANPFVASFRVNFLNHIKLKGRHATYLGFNAPRIFRVKRNDGVYFNNFFFDNEVNYQDMKKISELPSLTIPNVLVDHTSWFGSDEYLKRKANFGREHYKIASFIWTEEGLDVNQEYYRLYQKPLPIFTDA